MKKLSKLFLAMILAFTSIVVFNPNQTKAQEASTYAMATEITLNNKFEMLPVKYTGYDEDYYRIYITGSYMLNKSGSIYTITNADLSYSTDTRIVSENQTRSSATGNFEVVSFNVESISASSTGKLVLNYRLHCKTLSGQSLGYYYGSFTVGVKTYN